MYTQQQLNHVRKLTYEYSGISLSDNKDVMIANRLDKLKRILENENINELLEMVEKGHHVEVFINTFTTNKTNFFREEFHFDDLRERVAKEAINKKSNLKVFCSASSTGEEPYSILMTLEHAKESCSSFGFDYSLVATDIDTNVLNHAQNGIYEWNKNVYDFPDWIQPVKFFKRKSHPTKDGDYLIKVKEHLQRKVNFNRLNLMANSYPFKEAEFDVVFCRNVLIYFSQEDQNEILKKLFKTLKIGGTLYLGHSESPLELTSYVERYGQNIFVKVKEFI